MKSLHNFFSFNFSVCPISFFTSLKTNTYRKYFTIGGLISAMGLTTIYHFYKCKLPLLIYDEPNIKKKVAVNYEDKVMKMKDNLFIDRTDYETLLSQEKYRLKKNYKDKIANLIAEYEQLGEAKFYDSDYDSDDSVNDISEKIESEKKELSIQINEYKNKLSDDNNFFIKKEAYENLYDKFINTEKKKIKNNFVFAYTPHGDVMMYFNVAENRFCYYSNKTISNSVLISVCCKYVANYDAKYLLTLQTIEEEDEKLTIEERSIKERRNIKFCLKGNITNFTMLNKPPISAVNTKRGMSYSDYKKQQN